MTALEPQLPDVGGRLGDLDRAEAVALAAEDELGGLDVVVHNAATPKRRPVTALTAGEVEAVMRVNFLSPVRMTLALLPRMVERDAGVIVNVSSLGGRLGIATEAAYSASKLLCGWSESGPGLGHRRRGRLTSRRHRHGDLGPATTNALTAAPWRLRSWWQTHHRASEGDRSA